MLIFLREKLQTSVSRGSSNVGLTGSDIIPITQLLVKQKEAARRCRPLSESVSACRQLLHPVEIVLGSLTSIIDKVRKGILLTGLVAFGNLLIRCSLIWSCSTWSQHSIWSFFFINPFPLQRPAGSSHGEQAPSKQLDRCEWSILPFYRKCQRSISQQW